MSQPDNFNPPLTPLTKYKDVEAFLFEQLPMFQRIGPKAFKKNLTNIKYLSSILNDPHKEFKSIHIAGTNGKGSTSYFIASALSQMGFKVGLYTSPHYKDFTERIKIDGTPIPKREVKQFVNLLISKQVFQNKFKPSFFEITVAMAFSYFRDQKVDYAVVETGLGGRLDSTNIIRPVLSVITNIGFDHVNFLGNTLPKIAKEKAGIIKKNIPVIIGRKQAETTEVFNLKAKKTKSELTYADTTNLPIALNSLIGKLPDYQKENIKTSFTVLNKLFPGIDPKSLKQAWTSRLRSWGFMGRYTWLSKSPKILADSAHNKEGLEALFEQVKKEKFKQLHIVLAVVNDKDLSLVLTLFPKTAAYYFSQAKIPRALNAKELRYKASTYNLQGEQYTSIKRALAAAKLRAGSRDLILVTGSIFTVAEVV